MSRAPTVLMIAYYFPPWGGAGVQRTLKFVKYLPEFGWNPYVLSSRVPEHGLRDEALLKDIAPGTNIWRTQALLPPRRLPWRIRDFISRWLLTVDEQVGWIPFATRAGNQIIKENPVEAIYSTSAPYTAHLIAQHLHKQNNIPWIADFRDPWVGNSNLRFPTPMHRKLVERLEQQVIQDAEHILVISPPMGSSIIARSPGIHPSKITWLPNGYDAEDFSSTQPIVRDMDRFYLVYTGSFYNKGRTARSILEAVQAVTLSGQIPRNRLCVQLVGNIGKSTLNWISELNLEDIVETPGYVSHELSVGYLLAADVLLLIIGNSPDSSVVFTGKIFEYLAAGKPILCLANAGVASDLIRKAGAGVIVPPDDIAQISQNLVEMYQQWQNGKLSIKPNQEQIQLYDRRYLTGQLANILNQLIVKAA